MHISGRINQRMSQTLCAAARYHSPARAAGSNVMWMRYHSTEASFTGLSEKSQQAERTDLSIDDLLSRKYIYHDVLTPAPTKLLSAALDGYITNKDSELPDKNRQVSKNSNSENWIHLGYHQAYFRPLLDKTMMLDDGTDIRFIPGPADIWKYRLWAGGSVTLFEDKPWDSNVLSTVVQLEHAIDARVIGGGEKPGKVFVKVEKLLARVIDRVSGLSALAQDSIHNPSYRETHTLCFMRDLPAAFSSSRNKTEKIIKPPSNPMFEHTFTPTPSLLFHFSAITHNAHAIHIDREYTKREYGLRDLLVHGPLTLVMMIDFIRTSLGQATGNKQDYEKELVPRHIEYTNYKPLYVNEEITICCRPKNTAENEQGVHDADSWVVWIQTGSGEQASLAVKGTVKVSSLIP